MTAPQRSSGLGLCLVLLISAVLGLASQSAQAQSKEAFALEKAVGELRRAGRYSEAIPQAEELVRLVRGQVGEDHKNTAIVMNTLGLLYERVKRFSDAEPLPRRSLAIKEKLFGPGHPDVATGLNNLAVILRGLDRVAEAEALHRRALAIREKVLDPGTVTHWRVDSNAAVRLTTETFSALQKAGAIGRAEALRQAMLAYVDDVSNPWNAYPDYWAPFTIVGEGGR